jgi:hypothetical protein
MIHPQSLIFSAVSIATGKAGAFSSGIRLSVTFVAL